MARRGLTRIQKSGGKQMPRPKALPDSEGIDFRLPTVFPSGNRELGLRQQRVHTGGPGNPPDGFVTATTSSVEWMWYWGSAVYLKSPPDPRKPPYIGDGILWGYQVPDDVHDVRKLGSYVSDFVYYQPTGTLVVRLDTYFYHLQNDPEQFARDQYQKLHGGNDNVIVISAYDLQFLSDPSGRAIVAAVADALAGREIVSPVRSGTSRMVRDQITSEPAP